MQKIHTIVHPLASLTSLASAVLFAAAIDRAALDDSTFVALRFTAVMLLLLSVLFWTVFVIAKLMSRREMPTKK